MDVFHWLCRLSEADAPGQAAGLLSEFFSEFARVETDCFGGVTALLSSGEEKPVLMVDAHLDTIGMTVTAVEEQGFLRVGSCGRLDVRTLVGAEVTVWGKEPLYGVVCSTPPHLSKGDAKEASSVEELAIDVGFDRAGALLRVSPGDRVTLNQSCKPLLGDRVCGKSLDNRAGAVALMVAADRLRKEKDLPFHVLFSFSEQEETGGSPAACGVFRHRPKAAVVVDVSFAKGHGTPPEVEARLGGGPMLGIAANLSRNLFLNLKSTADRAGIATQTEVMGNRTGTNADRMVAAAGGLPCALISIPLGSMHTAVETVSLSDIQQTGLLIAECVKGGLCCD